MTITLKKKMVKVTIYNSNEKKEQEKRVERPNKIKDLTAYFQKTCKSGEVIISVEELPLLVKSYEIPDDVLDKYELKEEKKKGEER